MAARVALFEVEPGLTRALTPEDRQIARRVNVPVIALSPGPQDLDAELARHGAFGALIVEGMLLERVLIGSHSTLRMLGPSGVLAAGANANSGFARTGNWMAAGDCRLAVLGREFLAAGRQWPGLIAGLHIHTAEQAEHAVIQLAVGHLPRIEDRVLAVLWWLAETWGRTTPSGTLLPVSLTHEVLGALTGARRPTVTLAVGELADRGALLRQDQGWLLLEPPPQVPDDPEARDIPIVIDPGARGWRTDPRPYEDPEEAYAALRATVARLRREHEIASAALHERLEAVRESRLEIARQREHRARARVSRSSAPAP